MKYLISITLILFLMGCSSKMPPKDERMKASGHLDEAIPEKTSVDQSIPPVVNQLPIVSLPKPAENLQTFTVVATDLPASELLFALARDARLNLDIDPAISGNVSINAIDQTLPQILKRIARQVTLRFFIDGPNLIVQRDTPFSRVYTIDYLNMQRTTASDISIATQIASTGSSAEGGGGGGSNSSTNITSNSSNDFWSSMEANLNSLITNNGSTGSVIVNKESGTVSVNATSVAHENIQIFLDKVMSSARKQVLIEATVVEVTLNDDFQAGVDWSKIAIGDGFSFQQSVLGSALSASPFLAGTYNDTNSDRTITAAVKALDSFGDVSVMSSPKIMAINNQTSILKVVDNRVYFTTEIDQTEGTANNAPKTTLTTTIHTVPVGFVMNVTPYITENNEVILNVRPTISKILRFLDAPTIAGVAAGTNQVPEIQVREMESVLSVADGDTAIIGGLMQDSVSENSSGIPGLHDIDGFGFLFGQNERSSAKTELVIFLRPRVIENANLDGDLQDFKRYLKPRLLTE